jgi:hypothetical protein
MSLPSALDGIIVQLTRRGLPLDYAERAGTELVDHYRDLVSEQRAAGLDEAAAAAQATRRLGDPRTLVQKTVREYQRRHWCGRWPLLTFIFGPLVLVLATWIGTLLVLAAVGYALEAAHVKPPGDDGILSGGEQVFMACFVGWFMFVVPAAVLLFLSRRAARAGLGWQWVVLAAVILAVNVGSVQCGFSGSLGGSKFTDALTSQQLPPDTFVVSAPLLMFFSSISQTVRFFVDRPQQLGQLLLPVIVAALAIWRNRRLAHRWQQELITAC